jgi:glycerol-3-phosphate dehydrogenase
VQLPGDDRAQKIAALQATDENLARPLVESLPYTGAHLVYAVRSEMAQTLSDLLIRRTHLAFQTRDHGLSVAARVAEIVGPLLSWTTETKATRIREYGEDVGRMFAIS